MEKYKVIFYNIMNGHDLIGETIVDAEHRVPPFKTEDDI